MNNSLKNRLLKYKTSAEKHTGLSWQYFAKSAIQSAIKYPQDFITAADFISDDKKNRDRNSCGWYADSFEHDVIYAAVVRINLGARGYLFIPATYHTEWEGMTLYRDRSVTCKIKDGCASTYYGGGDCDDEITECLRYARRSC